MTTQTINETNISYHSEGFRQARPAINVKLYGLPWRTREMHDLGQRVGQEAAEAFLEHANERITNTWWNDAAAKATELGLGGIETEGRSGGWLVFTDGRDPQAMVTLDDRPDAVADPEGAEAWDDEIAERRVWLDAYSAMHAWVTGELNGMAERLAAEAVRLERAEHVADVTVYPDKVTPGRPDHPTTEERPVLARCLWCGQRLVDGAKESGYTGEGPDYMTPDGDFGCGDSPDTSEDGVGSHTPNVVTTADGHKVRIDAALLKYAVVGHPEGDDAGKAVQS